LQQLYRLEKSSPDFPHQLYDILQSKEHEQCVQNLQGGGDVMWLVNYLDKAVDGLAPSSDASQKCLSELKQICGARAILPTSYTLSSHNLTISSEPFASGGYGDVYQATLDGSRVRVKRVRVPHQRYLPTAQKAFCEGAITWKRLAHPNVLSLLGFTITPLQLVSDWMPNGDLPEFIENHPGADLIRLLSDVAEGLCYLHSCDVIHREIKGVRSCSNSGFTTALTPS